MVPATECRVKGYSHSVGLLKEWNGSVFFFCIILHNLIVPLPFGAGMSKIVSTAKIRSLITHPAPLRCLQIVGGGPWGRGGGGIVLFHFGWLKCCFTSTETVGLLGTGAQDVHLDFHTAPELWVLLKKFFTGSVPRSIFSASFTSIRLSPSSCSRAVTRRHFGRVQFKLERGRGGCGTGR